MDSDWPTQDDAPALRFGHPRSDSLTITYLRPERWDRHTFLVEADVWGFKVHFECMDTMPGEWPYFKDEVKVMDDKLTGKATLYFESSDVQIKGTMDRTGHVLWDIRLSFDYNATLTFRTGEDQTSLKRIASEVSAILECAASHH